MSAKYFTPVLVASLLLSMLAVISSSVAPASADSTYNLYNIPSNITPGAVYAHGDGTHTIADNNCNYSYSGSSSALSTATLEGSTVIDDVNKVVTESSINWQTQPCFYSYVAGVDSVSYFIQTTSTPSYRIVAARDNMTLWTSVVEDPDVNCKRYARIFSLSMGDNGDLYAVAEWLATGGSCVLKEAVIEIDPATGAINWATTLPGTGASTSGHQVRQLTPYNSGLAVLNAGSIYHYSYSGVQQSGTFTPSWSGAIVLQHAVVLDTGRVFILMRKYEP